MDPSFQNALVEVNLSTDGRNNVWLDAYFLDVQPSCLKDETEVTDNQGDGDENSGNNQSLMATIVMAVKDEPASFTITQQKHCHQLPMSQIRLKPKLTEPVSFNGKFKELFFILLQFSSYDFYFYSHSHNDIDTKNKRK